MIIRAVIEFNEKGFLVYAENFVGAFTRGKTKEEALGKLKSEVNQYLLWSTGVQTTDELSIEVVQEEKTGAEISDADTNIIFHSEKIPLSETEYEQTKRLVIKSAFDIKELYNSIPDKDKTSLSPRQTFYGDIPRTANEMFEHANLVSQPYVLGLVRIDDVFDIYLNRVAIFDQIEKLPNYLNSDVYEGSYNEPWSLKKVMRRFIWHDRIHAKAMYRMATKIWETDVSNPFHFINFILE